MTPADGSSTVVKIAADLRPSADGSAVRTGSQRACSLGSCAAGQTDGQTDEARYSKMPPRAPGITSTKIQQIC